MLSHLDFKCVIHVVRVGHAASEYVQIPHFPFVSVFLYRCLSSMEEESLSPMVVVLLSVVV